MRSGIEDGLRCPFTVTLANSSTTGAGDWLEQEKSEKKLSMDD
jgi:hypothetical protein